MSLLRVYFDSPFHADRDSDRALTWALYPTGEDHAPASMPGAPRKLPHSSKNVPLREGRDTLKNLPKAAAREAVLSVRSASCAALKLPPMTGARLDGAVKLALEDRIATPISELTIVSRKSGDLTLAFWAESVFLKALSAAGFTRAVFEPDLAQSATGVWRVCFNADGAGFVKRDDGSAVVLHLDNENSLPAELTLALKQASPAPADIKLHAENAVRLSSAWSKTWPDIHFHARPVWRWQEAPASAFDKAQNLLPEIKKKKPAADQKTLRRWKLAAAVFGAAIALQILATLLAWGGSQFERWRVNHGWNALAATANVTAGPSLLQTQQRLDRAYAALRHRAGRDAPNDALPLLAQSAPALNALPQGAIRRMTYDGASWTFECKKIPAESQRAVETALRRAGLAALGAMSASGYRLRVTQESVTP
jgi:hypothetical protein